ncbi:tyrosine-protein phosphatase [Frankia sp. CcWB2]
MSTGSTATAASTGTAPGAGDGGAPQARRALSLPGTINLRDVGGYPTVHGRSLRWRTLLRSGTLRGLDGRGQAILAQIGLRTVIDLREDTEVAHDPDQLGRLAATHRRVPVYTLPVDRHQTAGDLRSLYDHVVDHRGDRLTAAMLALAAPGALPAIVHCSAGKDRTGLVIALALDLAGVPAEVIAQDFALTSYFLRDEAAAAVQRISALMSTDGEELPASLMASPPDLILHALGRIHARHGDTHTYLLAHGATAHALDRLVEALLVPAEASDAGPDSGPATAGLTPASEPQARSPSPSGLRLTPGATPSALNPVRPEAIPSRSEGRPCRYSWTQPRTRPPTA